MTVLGFSHLQFWVRDARATALFLQARFGFSVAALDQDGGTGSVPHAYELRQGEIVFFVTDATAYPSDVSDFVGRHGDGVRDLALSVDDAAAVGEQAMAAGAEAMPSRNGASDRVIKGFGDTVHSLVERSTPATPATPGSGPTEDEQHIGEPSVNLLFIDHCAVSVDAGERERWARFYEEALGMPKVPGDRKVEVDGSAFTMSTVQVPDGDAALVLAEPTTSSRKSQIADYLDHFQGPGVHHIALSTDDIVQTVTALRARGMRMLDVPASYLETGGARLHGIDLGADWRELARLGILVDADEDGYLLQAFTPPIGDRPTTCFEIIQREGTRGFGAHNVRDLYAQVVREQERRDLDQA
jgi:4-hydroxyphenylpyruvate dioxygenase